MLRPCSAARMSATRSALDDAASSADVPLVSNPNAIMKLHGRTTVVAVPSVVIVDLLFQNAEVVVTLLST